jgi:hypothetical protein
LFGVAFVARAAVDWFAPTEDFHTRSMVTTYVAISLFLVAGFWAAWRSASFVAGPVAGIATAGIGAGVSIVGAALLLAIWHDADTLAAIRGSGGVDEVFVLPFLMFLPGLVLGSIGGVAGAAGKKLLAMVR